MTMTTATTSTFEIEIRARGALAKGRTFRYIAPDDTTVQLQYVAGGSFASTVTCNADGERVSGRTDASLTLVMRTFLAEVRAAARRGQATEERGFAAGIIAAIGVLDQRITAWTADDDRESEQLAAELRRARFDLLALLNGETA